MFTMIISAVLCICIIFLMHIRWKKTAHKLPPKYPGALPLLGHVHLLLTDPETLWQRLQDSASYSFMRGGVIHALLGSQIYYLITDPQDALKAANACIQRHFVFDYLKPRITGGFVNSTGETWKRHRKLLNPAFSIPVVHGFLEIFNNQARKFINQLEPLTEKGPFNHHTYLREIMLEIFCLASFGIDAIENKNFIRKYIACLDKFLEIVTKRFTMFWLHSDILYKLSGLKRIEYETTRFMSGMSNEILQRKKLAMKNRAVNHVKNETQAKEIKFKPFMDLILELSADGSLTDKEIRREIDIIICVGFETTSNQLMYTLLLLGAHPDVQDKLLTEILEVLGPNGDVTKDDLNKLIYTNAVMMECIRLIPSVPIVLRHVETDVKLKNYTMLTGSDCVIYPLLNQHEPMWGPEGNKFKPERWLDDDSRSGSKEFAGFGLGKRSCIGKQYSLVSMKVMLAHIIRFYKITADISKLKLKYEFVLKPVVEQLITIERRN